MDKIKIRLHPGRMNTFVGIGHVPFTFFDKVSGISLNAYHPEDEVEIITPSIQRGLDQKVLVIVEEPAQVVEEDILPVVTQEPDEAEAEKKVRPASEVQCTSKTKAGTRCKRMAMLHSAVCVFHADEAELARVDEELAKETGIDNVPGD